MLGALGGAAQDDSITPPVPSWLWSVLIAEDKETAASAALLLLFAEQTQCAARS